MPQLNTIEEAKDTLWSKIKELEEKQDFYKNMYKEFQATIQINFGKKGRCVAGIFGDMEINPSSALIILCEKENLKKILKKIEEKGD